MYYVESRVDSCFVGTLTIGGSLIRHERAFCENGFNDACLVSLKKKNLIFIFIYIIFLNIYLTILRPSLIQFKYINSIIITDY